MGDDVSIEGYLQLLQVGAYAAVAGAVILVAVLMAVGWTLITVRRMEYQQAVFMGYRQPRMPPPPPAHPVHRNRAAWPPAER